MRPLQRALASSTLRITRGPLSQSMLRRSFNRGWSSEAPESSSNARRWAYGGLFASTAGLLAYAAHDYLSPTLRADASDSQDDASSIRSVRSVLHGNKEHSYAGVDVEYILKRCEESVLLPGTGVWRYDINQVESNSPTEDDHAEAVVRSPAGTDWHFWTVIDGHVGWETSMALSQRLIPCVSGALTGLYRRNPSPSGTEVDAAIRDAFLALDDEFVNKPIEIIRKNDLRGEAAKLLSQALAGAVALLAFYNPASSEVKIALTGDLRAVRGRRGANGQWETTVLTVEQDGDNEEEAARIRKEHPNEPDVVKGGRVLGWQPTRMFGDASLKWSLETQDMIRRKFLGSRPRDVIKTPPYVSAEPVITTTDIQPGDFLVLGCDGIWESLTSEEAVKLVGTWLDGKHTQQEGPKTKKGSWLGGWFGTKTGGPVRPDPSPQNKEKTVRYEQWQIPKQFVNVDSNAATHLIRNCLGGADTNTMQAVLTRTGSLARRLRRVQTRFIQSWIY
ncbi:related to Type 2C Protein Phosphatase [Serendipita indica DSM 11827]|uniref:Related to Type 2C Protein Phosphatase n=1 Tax=Serendipita indica (strain DSM 11827) TaxID=1109443 RepID=G4T8V9_SERID|nr:related to Type 2C Protein Phosphatase [Serendipita indica DSM 11827]